MDIEITEMKLSDLSSISSRLQTDFDDFWTTSLLKSEIENDHTLCLVAKSGQIIVGFACIWFSVDDVHITNIVTNVHYRNQGIASKLLEEIIHKIKNKPLTLEVRSSNEPAIHLYEKFGFEKIGIRKNYYTYNNKTEDAIIMTKTQS